MLETTTHIPVSLQEYTWRPITRHDSVAMNTLLLAVEAHDQRGWVDTLEDRERDINDPESNPTTDSLAAFLPDGQMVAYGWVFTPPASDTECISFLDGAVHPAYRRRGLGTYIVSWTERRGSQIQRTIPGEQARFLRLNAHKHLVDTQKLFEQQGFQPVRYYYRMRRDLSQPIPDIQLPDHLQLQTWNSDLNSAALSVVNETFEDHWGHIPLDEEHYQTWIIQHEYFRPELSFMVMDGDQIAGLTINRIRVAENEAAGIKEGWIGTLGVRRPWRNQGLASAILSASMRAFKAAGMQTVGLTVDADNLTGALRIYERLGFFVVLQINQYSKTIHME
jgi:mycothiol synthase